MLTYITLYLVSSKLPRPQHVYLDKSTPSCLAGQYLSYFFITRQQGCQDWLAPRDFLSQKLQSGFLTVGASSILCS